LWNFALEADIAVLHTNKSLQTCSWADSDEIALAQTLYAIGWPNSPDGESSITKGIFLATFKPSKGRLLFKPTQPLIPAILADH